jgi:ABC-type uncharacterized transport system involved in gliding motility auxiliary subunit
MYTNESAARAAGRLMGLLGVVALASGGYAGLMQGFREWTTLVQFAIGVGGIAVFFWLYLPYLGQQFTGRGSFFLLTSVVSALVVTAALVGINYIAVKKPKSWDLTKDRIFTLSDQTTSVLKGLQVPVKVEAFYAGSEPEYPELDSRLRQYKAQTDKLTVEFVDPFKHPGRVKELNISQSGPRIIVTSGNKESRAKETSEEALTNALIEVSRGSTKKIYFTKGHGEHAVGDNTERGLKQFVDNLKSEGYQTDEIVLAEHKEMPADAQALVVAGPVAALTDGEAKLVKEWIEKGGKLVAMVDPGVQSGLESAFEGWGIHVGKDEVIDPEAQNPEVAIAQSYAEHPITQPRSSPFALATIFPLARSVSKAQTAPAGWTVTELAKTGPRAWGETGTVTSGTVKFDPAQDLKGPVSLAASSTKGAESRVVVVGNSLFASNGYYRLSGNKDFALNAVSWTAKEESRISIRPKQRQGNHLFLSAEQKRTMTLFAFDLLPFGLLFAGLVVWQTRKSR